MSYTYSFIGSPTYSFTFPVGGSVSSTQGLDQMMNSVPDNDSNLIKAQDVRNSLFTLWKRSDELEQIITSTVSNFRYTNSSPSKNKIGSWEIGSTFSEVQLQELFDGMFYPYLEPIVSIEVSPPFDFKGSNSSVILSWEVIKTDLNIQSITVFGTTFSVTGETQTGTASFSPIKFIDTDFDIVVFDGVSTQSRSTQFNWKELVYWGTKDTFGSTFSNSDILGLSFSTLADNFKGDFYGGFDPLGEYLAFSWPSYFGEPIFLINGMVNNSFTKIHGSGGLYPSLNYQLGTYSTNYDFWLSDNPQFSPISIIEIK